MQERADQNLNLRNSSLVYETVSKKKLNCTVGHFCQETSIPIMPINKQNTSFATDPTMYRWRKGFWATISDWIMTGLIGYLVISPLSKFGTVSSQKSFSDESIKSFELSLEEMKFDELKVDIRVTYKSWYDMNAELGGEATQEQILNHFCNEYIDVLFYILQNDKETGEEKRIDYIPKSCEYIRNQENEEHHYITLYNFVEPPDSHFEVWKEWDRVNSIDSYSLPYVLFEKLEKDSQSVEILYNIWISSFKPFECDGIFIRSNHDYGHYSAITTEMDTFKFTGHDLNEHGQIISIGTVLESYNYRWDLSQTQNASTFGTTIKKEAKLMVEETEDILKWSDQGEGGIVFFTNPTFPVEVTENTMYTFTDYIVSIGGQYSVLITVVTFFAQKFLYPAIIKDLGDELKQHELETAEYLNYQALDQSMDDQDKKSILVNKYLNWVTILRSTIKTDKLAHQFEYFEEHGNQKQAEQIKQLQKLVIGQAKQIKELKDSKIRTDEQLKYFYEQIKKIQ